MSQRNSVLKWSLIGLVEIEMLLFSGMIYGINSIYPTMINLGYFCSKENITKIIVRNCAYQNLYLGYLFITITVSTSFFAIPIGLIMDNCGGTVTKIACAITSLSGFLSFALSSVFSPYLAFLACVLIGYFTFSCMMGNFALASLIPDHQNIIMSVFSCSFDFSCIVMTLISYAYNRGISLLKSFSTLGIICTLLCISTAILNQVIKRRSLDGLNGYEIIEESNEPVHGHLQTGIEEVLEERINETFPTLRSVLTSRFYIIHIINLSLLSLGINFFLSELIIHLNLLFPHDSNLVKELLVNSNYVLASGLLLSPFPGLLINFMKRLNNQSLLLCTDNEKYIQYMTAFVPSLFICCFVCQGMYLLLLVPHKAAIYSSYVLLMILRVTLFSTNSIYLISAFPKRFFGQILGIGFFVSGLVSFIQYGIVFPDKARLDVVNYCVIGSLFVAYIHPIVLYTRFWMDYRKSHVDGYSD